MIPRRLVATARWISLFALAFLAGLIFERTRSKPINSTPSSVIHHHHHAQEQAQSHPIATNAIITDINSAIPIPLPTTTGTTTTTAQNDTGNIGPRANAAFVVLLQNKDLHDMRKTMRNLESVFNRKHGYPYVFLNNVPFTEHFKTHIRAMTTAPVKFGKDTRNQIGLLEAHFGSGSNAFSHDLYL
jgi:alpha 1,2-mannosyltransferase